MLKQFEIEVDLRNPAQFYACCGIFEMAHVLWKDVQAKFVANDERHSQFVIASDADLCSLKNVIDAFKALEVIPSGEGANKGNLEEDDESDEDAAPEANTDSDDESADDDATKPKGKDPADKQQLILRAPNQTTWYINWWDGDRYPYRVGSVKTWAGRVEVAKVISASIAAIEKLSADNNPLNFSTTLNKPREAQEESKETTNKKAKRKTKDKKPDLMQPLSMDPRNFILARDLGFSADSEGYKAQAYSFIELSALVGLQRFHPGNTTNKKDFLYSAWHDWLQINTAAAVACGIATLSNTSSYAFHMLARGDGKYKTIGFSKPTYTGDKND